jgi:hypothetical protein
MSTKTRIGAGLIAAAGALAIFVAPAAQAAAVTQNCTAEGQDATLCQSEGNAQISATPPAVDYQAQYPFFGIGGYGSGLDFHHGGHR